MATIHSLPPELIKHTLALAYAEYDQPLTPEPHHNDGRLRTHKLGLAAAALVHSSWRTPAQELLTADLAFSHCTRDDIALDRLCAPGRAKLRCRRLELREVRPERALRLLELIEEGSVVELLFRKSSHDKWPVGFYELPALKELRILTTEANKDFTPWPAALTKLNLQRVRFEDGPLATAPLVSSASTLRSLSLYVHDPVHLANFPNDVKHLSHLASLSITHVTFPAHKPAPATLLAAAYSVPPDARLELRDLYPTQLLQFLEGMPADLRIGELRTPLTLPMDHNAHSPPARAVNGWTDTLKRCARHPSLGRIARWRVAMRSPHRMWPAEAVGEQELAQLFGKRRSDGEETALRWPAVKEMIAEQGVELVYEEPIAIRDRVEVVSVTVLSSAAFVKRKRRVR